MKIGFNKVPGKLMMQGPCTQAELMLIQQHTRFRAIDFWGCNLKTLDCVLPLKKLDTICFYGGSVADFSALNHLPTLSELFINSLNRYGDLGFLIPLTQLKRLQLLHLSKLEAFPNLSNHTQLTTIRIWDCKRLADIRALAHIPNLQELDMLNTPHVPDDFIFLLETQNIQRISVTFGTVKENKRFAELLNHYGKVSS